MIYSNKIVHVHKEALMKISQQMIADFAGVSRGTVDRVLHGKPNVNPQTREKVLDAIEKLGYKPNMIARALSLSKRRYSICVVMPENSFFESVKEGIDAAISELGDYNISVSYISTEGKANEEIIKAINCDESNAYMVALGDTSDIRECIRQKTEAGIPVITFNTDIRNCGRLCFVGQNLKKSGRVAASLMLKLMSGKAGKLLIVTGNSKYKAHRERVEGFCEVVEGSGLKSCIAGIVETNDKGDLTRDLVGKALDEDPEIAGIYLASGHVSAFAELLRARNQKYNVIINDLYPVVEKALKDNIIDFTIFQNPFEQGYKPVKLLFDFIFGGIKPDEEYYYTANTIITDEIV